MCAETFGLSACEALSCGTPVIASRCGGPEDIVTDDVGLLYSSEEQLLEHLDRVWNDGELRERLGKRARERYDEHYTPQAYLARYLEEVAGARERRASSRQYA